MLKAFIFGPFLFVFMINNDDNNVYFYQTHEKNDRWQQTHSHRKHKQTERKAIHIHIIIEASIEQSDLFYWLSVFVYSISHWSIISSSYKCIPRISRRKTTTITTTTTTTVTILTLFFSIIDIVFIFFISLWQQSSKKPFLERESFSNAHTRYHFSLASQRTHSHTHTHTAHTHD